MLRAELALDAIKQRGGGALLFNEQMEELLAQKWLNRGEIERALANDEFALHYQPTFDMATRDIVGAEGLIRWHHPVRGLVMPAEFIDFAERNGLIRAITVWVFERLIRDLLSTASLPDRVRCYINTPAQQVDDPAFAAMVREQLRAQPQLARHIGFEITETGVMLNVRGSIAALQSFRDDGISISIDDFGTGFSSLSYLKHLPADVIKIDQSFVAGIPHDVKDMTLADTFIWLANAFHFVTLAEGIETEEQAVWLTEHGCKMGQGFLVARAMPFADFVAMLAPALV
jgi:EAL domain-containing protein (putative c-di-GMP-specific phosphodiesterase class I)